ncbi:MAG: phosphatase PAP2 family protein [Bacteroidetes bacterium]|nr:phosphatase PAP2 family protein [Bacteroidota bacterium]
MSRFFTITLLFYFFSGIYNADAQYNSPYRLSKKKDWPLLISGAGLMTSGILLVSNIVPPEVPGLNTPDISDIVFFDRSALDNLSIGKASTSDVLQYAAIALPLTFLAIPQTRKDFPTIGMMALEVFLINTGLNQTIKGIAQRDRPFTYNPDAPLEDRTSKGARTSFYSGHTASVAAFSFFFAKVISDYSDNPTLKTFVWIGAASLPLATAYLRVASGKHFTTDVMVGYADGAAIGYLIPHIHKILKKNPRLSVVPSTLYGSSGLGVIYRF